MEKRIMLTSNRQMALAALFALSCTWPARAIAQPATTVPDLTPPPILQNAGPDPLGNGAANGVFLGAFASVLTHYGCEVGWHCAAGTVAFYGLAGALVDLARDGRGSDPVWDGALIGAAIALPAPGGMFNNNCDVSRTAACVAGIVGVYAAIGLAIDAAHRHRPPTRTASTPTRSVVLSPIATPDRNGLMLSVRWR